MKFGFDSKKIDDDTVLLFGISYSGMSHSRAFTYAMLKAGGLWYVTGSGRVPIAAGWLAVERWLERDGRLVEWVKILTEAEYLWPPRLWADSTKTGEQE